MHSRLSISLRTTLVLALLIPAPILAQSAIVPDSTVRTICAFSHANGDLEAAGFMDLDDGAIPTNRSYQGAVVNNELWFTDDVLGRITRWNRYGSVQLGSIDLTPHRLRGITTAFGSVWVGAGTPSLQVQDFLAQLTPTGQIVQMHPMPGMVNSIAQYNNMLLVSIEDFDDLVFVDPTTGAVGATFVDSNGVNGFDSPQQVEVLPNGHVLVGSALPPAGFFEFDAQGNQVNYVDTGAFPFGGGARGVHRLADGRTLVSTVDNVLRYDPMTMQVEVLIDSLILYYFTLVPSIPLGTPECGPAVVNSSGRPGTISAVGSSLLSETAVRLCAQDLPVASNGYFLCSLNAGFVPTAGGSQGTLCLGGTVGRFNQQIQFSANDGFFSMTVDPLALPQPTGAVAIMPGQTWRFQCWYRDANPNSTSNFTNATAVTFQ